MLLHSTTLLKLDKDLELLNLLCKIAYIYYTFRPDPPENCHIKVQKLPENYHFSQKLQKKKCHLLKIFQMTIV